MTLFFISLLTANAIGHVDYIVTDVICASGKPVANQIETVSIGVIIPGRLAPNFEELTHIYSELNTDLHEIFTDKEKFVLFTNTTRFASHYISGPLPCSEGEQYLVIGKAEKQIIQP